MRSYFIKTYNLLLIFGLDPVKTFYSIKGLLFYIKSLKELKKQEKNAKYIFSFGKLYPCLTDRYEEGGSATGHYFHQDLLVARKIFNNKPNLHIDVGSRVDGFVSHVASFRDITVFDIRPISYVIPNITFKEVDFMQPLDMQEVCDSISCLHAIEHFGLGRYGDPIQYDGYLLGIKNLTKILMKNGKLYFSVPIGVQRIEFNGHRVFSLSFLLEIFSERFHIDDFSYVDDNGDLHSNMLLDTDNINNNFNCEFGLGIFEMTKK